MISENDYEIGERLNNESPYFEIIVSFSFCGRATIHHKRFSYNTNELSINDILGTILYYLKYGNDRQLKNKDIGFYVTKFLKDCDLIYDDVACEIDDVCVFYIDRLFCRHKVEFPTNLDINIVIEKIKNYINAYN